MALARNWFQEKQSAWLYRVMAEAELQPDRRRLFSALAEAAEDQAGIWRTQMEQGGEAVPEFRPSLRGRLAARLVRRFGPAPMAPVLAALKVRGLSIYRARPPGMGHPMPASVAEVGSHHRGAGRSGSLRAAVFGVNDGLVSNTSLIMGMAGATGDSQTVLTAGLAGLLAGALSMAAGEYVSMRSQRELYEYQIALEREELKEYPLEEAEELALIYHARGVPLGQARFLAESLMRDPDHALDTLAREELGLNPDDLGAPWGAALSSFAAFTVGAVIPLVPFLAGARDQVGWTAGLAAAALFAVGSTLSLFTGRSAWWSGLRMVLIGGGAGVATYLIGALLGVRLA